MKVGFDVAQTCAQRAGCPWYADALARALAGIDGVDLELYHHFGSWCNDSTAGGTRVDGVPAPLAALSETEARAFWAQVAGEGLPGRPDIVHANSFAAPAIPGSRMVFTIYDLSFWLHPEFAHSATHVVCQRGVMDALERAAGIAFISEAGRADFERLIPGWLETSGRPTTVLHGASRFAGEVRTGLPGPDAPWLCVGSIEPRKNHAALLDAYLAYRRMVDNPRPLFIAGGRGWSSEATHARMRDAASEGVRYLGYVPDEELPRLYREAFGLVQPSWHEGFGLPVVEAMGFGCPVLCADIPTLREVAGKASLYFAPDDPQRLAQFMARMEEDPALTSDLTARATERAREFSWEATARRAVAFYREILAAAPAER